MKSLQISCGALVSITIANNFLVKGGRTTFRVWNSKHFMNVWIANLKKLTSSRISKFVDSLEVNFSKLRFNF